MVGLRDRGVMLGVRPDWGRLQRVCEAVEASAAYLYAPGGYRPKVDLCAPFLDPLPSTRTPPPARPVAPWRRWPPRTVPSGGITPLWSKERGVGWIGHADVDLHDVGHRVLVGGAAVLVLSGTIEVLPIHGSGGSIQGGLP